MMVSNVKGAFGKFTASVDGSPADPATAKISATIEIASVDTRDAKRDEHLRAADFFDAAKFPQMTFTSTKVEKVSATTAKVTGNLTLRGVTKPVVLDVEYTAAREEPLGEDRRRRERDREDQPEGLRRELEQEPRRRRPRRRRRGDDPARPRVREEGRAGEVSGPTGRPGRRARGPSRAAGPLSRSAYP